MTRARLVWTLAGACAIVAACAAPVDGAPVVHIAEAAKPSPVRVLDAVLPTADELARVLHSEPGGLMGQLVHGGADMLLRSIGQAEAAPAECVSPAYSLQQVVYGASRVRSVATRPWFGVGIDGPTYSGFLGAVQFATADDAQAFFAAAADAWRRCDGQMVAVHRPEHGADALSKVTDVLVQPRVVSAVVINGAGGASVSPVQRALGVASDCVVDVEITDMTGRGGDATGAVGVADVMLGKIA